MARNGWDPRQSRSLLSVARDGHSESQLPCTMPYVAWASKAVRGATGQIRRPRHSFRVITYERQSPDYAPGAQSTFKSRICIESAALNRETRDGWQLRQPISEGTPALAVCFVTLHRFARGGGATFQGGIRREWASMRGAPMQKEMRS